MSKQLKVQLKNGEQISLTEKELLFCNYYLADAKRNGTEAAKMAGYSDKTAAVISTENLTKPNIQKYLTDQTAPVLEALGATKDRILAEWAELALSRPGQDITKDSVIPLGYQETHNFKTLQMDGMLVDSHEKQVAYNYGPKMKALTAISQHLGIITKDGGEPPVQNVTMFNQINHNYNSK